jgi:hypothetical protein
VATLSTYGNNKKAKIPVNKRLSPIFAFLKKWQHMAIKQGTNYLLGTKRPTSKKIKLVIIRGKPIIAPTKEIVKTNPIIKVTKAPNIQWLFIDFNRKKNI